MSLRFHVKSTTTGKTNLVPCENSNESVQTLKKKILSRCCPGTDASDYKLVLAGSDAVLDEKDAIKDALRDGDYISLINKCETMSDDHRSTFEDISTLPCYDSSLCQALGNDIKSAQWIELDGSSLTIEELMKIGQGKLRIKLSENAKGLVSAARAVVDGIVQEEKVSYGITTGFGKFQNKTISKADLEELQENLILSHAVGVGPPLPPDQVRRLLALRINILAKGFSGIRLETIQKLIDALNASCLPYIPLKGTVGASGDLAPLGHLALGMIGEGRMWHPTTGWGQAKDILKNHGLEVVKLGPKEGLSMINGTQFITAIGAEAVHRAELIAKQADIIAALTIEVLYGVPQAFDPDIHASPPHPGQQLVAKRLRALVKSDDNPSELHREGDKAKQHVQDAYTMRCVPQVHGVVNDTINFVKGIIETEMNSALDNPLVFAHREEVLSGGNFHGEYPAKALDYLAMGVHELANISERRLERLIHPSYNEELPAFLVEEGGLNSGFMIAHCTAAALVSENKVLTHPSSVDSITTSAGSEDHVSMGGFAARKALEVVEHVEHVLAIELLAACKGLDLRRPKTTTPPLEKVFKLVRTVAKTWKKDRYFAPDMQAVTKLLREGKIWEEVKEDIENF